MKGVPQTLLYKQKTMIFLRSDPKSERRKRYYIKLKTSISRNEPYTLENKAKMKSGPRDSAMGKSIEYNANFIGSENGDLAYIYIREIDVDSRGEQKAEKQKKREYNSKLRLSKKHQFCFT